MNTKQQEAFDLVCSGKNVLLTGPAGTGKSYTLQEMFAWANTKRFGVTASTGLAAFLIGGRTIHSFLGIGLGKKPVDVTVTQIKYKNKPAYNNIINLDILFIDEISMIDKNLLDYISQVLSMIRNCDKPFGGVQVVLCGDFCQLPPVDGEFCFLSEVWKTANLQTVVLEDLIRQDRDPTFQNILKDLRWGKCSKSTLDILKKCTNTTFADGIIPTKLFPTNNNVDNINNAELSKLKESGASVRTYKTIYQGPDTWCKYVHEEIELCVGAQVMCTTNLQGTNICNGTRGVVVELGNSDVIIRLVNGQNVSIPYTKTTCIDNKKHSVNFMPLKLAYAISIHKSQGMTLDAVEIDIGDSIFTFGQGYVAITRARSLESIKIISVKASSFRVHPKVKEFYGEN